MHKLVYSLICCLVFDILLLLVLVELFSFLIQLSLVFLHPFNLPFSFHLSQVKNFYFSFLDNLDTNQVRLKNPIKRQVSKMIHKFLEASLFFSIEDFFDEINCSFFSCFLDFCYFFLVIFLFIQHILIRLICYLKYLD